MIYKENTLSLVLIEVEATHRNGSAETGGSAQLLRGRVRVDLITGSPLLFRSFGIGCLGLYGCIFAVVVVILLSRRRRQFFIIGFDNGRRRQRLELLKWVFFLIKIKMKLTFPDIFKFLQFFLIQKSCLFWNTFLDLEIQTFSKKNFKKRKEKPVQYRQCRSVARSPPPPRLPFSPQSSDSLWRRHQCRSTPAVPRSRRNAAAFCRCGEVPEKSDLFIYS